MAAEEWQHEKRNAVMVQVAGAAKMADCGLLEKSAITALTTKDTKEHEVVVILLTNLREPSCPLWLKASVVEASNFRWGGAPARRVFPGISGLHPERPGWGRRSVWPGDIR